MPKDKTILIREYLKIVKAANKELIKKEAFKDLLNRLYAGNPETESIINKITLGAEKTIVNIPRKDHFLVLCSFVFAIGINRYSVRMVKYFLIK